MSMRSVAAGVIAFCQEGLRSGILIGYLLGVLTITCIAPGELIYSLIAATAGGVLGSVAIILRLLKRNRLKREKSGRELD